MHLSDAGSGPHLDGVHQHEPEPDWGEAVPDPHRLETGHPVRHGPLHSRIPGPHGPKVSTL